MRHLKRFPLAAHVMLVSTMTLVLIVIAYLDNDRAAISWNEWLHPWKIWQRITSGTRTSCCGREARTDADVQALVVVVELFENRAKRLPTQQEGLQVLWKGLQGENGPSVPKPMSEAPLDPWGRHYQYRVPAKFSGTKFDLFSLGPDGVVSADDTAIGSRPKRYR